MAQSASSMSAAGSYAADLSSGFCLTSNKFSSTTTNTDLQRHSSSNHWEPMREVVMMGEKVEEAAARDRATSAMVPKVPSSIDVWSDASKASPLSNQLVNPCSWCSTAEDLDGMHPGTTQIPPEELALSISPMPELDVVAHTAQPLTQRIHTRPAHSGAMNSFAELENYHHGRSPAAETAGLRSLSAVEALWMPPPLMSTSSRNGGGANYAGDLGRSTSTTNGMAAHSQQQQQQQCMASMMAMESISSSMVPELYRGMSSFNNYTGASSGSGGSLRPTRQLPRPASTARLGQQLSNNNNNNHGGDWGRESMYHRSLTSHGLLSSSGSSGPGAGGGGGYCSPRPTRNATDLITNTALLDLSFNSPTGCPLRPNTNTNTSLLMHAHHAHPVAPHHAPHHPSVSIIAPEGGDVAANSFLSPSSPALRPSFISPELSFEVGDGPGASCASAAIATAECFALPNVLPTGALGSSILLARGPAAPGAPPPNTCSILSSSPTPQHGSSPARVLMQHPSSSGRVKVFAEGEEDGSSISAPSLPTNTTTTTVRQRRSQQLTNTPTSTSTATTTPTASTGMAPRSPAGTNTANTSAMEISQTPRTSKERRDAFQIPLRYLSKDAPPFALEQLHGCHGCTCATSFVMEPGMSTTTPCLPGFEPIMNLDDDDDHDGAVRDMMEEEEEEERSDCSFNRRYLAQIGLAGSTTSANNSQTQQQQQRGRPFGEKAAARSTTDVFGRRRSFKVVSSGHYIDEQNPLMGVVESDDHPNNDDDVTTIPEESRRSSDGPLGEFFSQSPVDTTATASARSIFMRTSSQMPPFGDTTSTVADDQLTSSSNNRHSSDATKVASAAAVAGVGQAFVAGGGLPSFSAHRRTSATSVVDLGRSRSKSKSELAPMMMHHTADAATSSPAAAAALSDGSSATFHSRGATSINSLSAGCALFSAHDDDDDDDDAHGVRMSAGSSSFGVGGPLRMDARPDALHASIDSDGWGYVEGAVYPRRRTRDADNFTLSGSVGAGSFGHGSERSDW